MSSTPKSKTGRKPKPAGHYWGDEEMRKETLKLSERVRYLESRLRAWKNTAISRVSPYSGPEVASKIWEILTSENQ